MKDFWGYFVLAFVAFLIWGFYNGYGLRREVIKEKVYKQIILDEKNGRPALIHFCEGKPTIAFDVDSDSLKPELETLGREADYRLAKAPSEKHLEYKELVMSFVGPGAATAFFTIKDMPKILAEGGKSNWLKMLGTFAGGVSGYLIGKWLGSRIGIGCDSQLATAYLNDPSQWLATEKDYLTFSLLAMRWRSDPVLVGKELKNINSMSEEPLFELDSPLKTDFDFLESRCQLKANPNAADFARLDRLNRIYATITEQADYDSLIFQHQLKSLRREGLNPPGRFTFRQASWDSAAVRIQRTIAGLYESSY